MIKFYRKIRQNLLMENKTGKYFKYAVGEIVLVVIGILIALQINTSSQQKTNRDHIENILKSVYYNLESDMADPINRYIGFCEFKDSLNNLLLTQDLSFKDYELSGQGSRGLGRLLTYEIEPFQFEDQAYERLLANMEIIPEEYMPIVETLQDVYSKEVPVVNEVAIEIKSFVDEIEDKYQTNFDWYSNTDDLHIKQKIDYMLRNPKHLNDVKMHQYIVDHLLGHLNTLRTNVSIAYSKIYDELMFNEPFSEITDRFYFPTEDELDKYAGNYILTDNPSNVMQFSPKKYYLTLVSNGYRLKLIKIGDNKFAASIDTKGTYIEFIENKNGLINAFNLNRIIEKDTISSSYKKIDQR